MRFKVTLNAFCSPIKIIFVYRTQVLSVCPYLLFKFSLHIHITFQVFKFKKKRYLVTDTICPRSSDPFHIVTYYMKWVTTSSTYSNGKCKEPAAMAAT